MKIHLSLAIVGLAISFALPTFGQQTNTPDPQLRQVIDALGAKSDEAFNNGDGAAAAALFTEDAVLVTDKGPVYGREAIEKHFPDEFKKYHFSNHRATAEQNSPHTLGPVIQSP
jgi:uncharacterized protein (TIGR02246 family)